LKDTAAQFKLTNKHVNTIDRYYTSSLAKCLGFEEVYAIRVKDEQEAVKNGMVYLYGVLLKKNNAVSCKTLGEEDCTFLASLKPKTFLPVFNPKMFSELFKNDKHLVHKFVTMFKEASEIKNNTKSGSKDYSYYLLEVDKKQFAKMQKQAVTITFGLNTIYKKITKQYPMLSVNPRLFSTNSYNYHMNAVRAMMCQAIQYINLIDKMGKSA